MKNKTLNYKDYKIIYSEQAYKLAKQEYNMDILELMKEQIANIKKEEIKMIYDDEIRERLEDERFAKVHPAIELANKVRELFKHDPALKLYWNEDKYTVYIYSTHLKKAEAIRYILKEKYEYSECAMLFVEVYYKIDNDTKVLIGRPRTIENTYYNPQLFVTAFEGNPLWVYIHEWKHKLLSNAHCWAGFSNQAITYPDDNLTDLYGFSTYLPADIAKEVLDTDGIHICTYNPEHWLIRRNTVANSLYEDTIDWNDEE